VAEEKLSNILGFGIKPVDVKDTWKTSAKIKAEKKIPLADCFTIATALKLDATLVVREDTDFADLKIKMKKI
jgi:predicted nucleic acid-binding protein